MVKAGRYMGAALPALLLLWCCHPKPYVADQPNHRTYSITSDSIAIAHAHMVEIIKPYKLRVDSMVSEELITCEGELKKELPEGSLNNMFCDLLAAYVQRTTSDTAVVCVMNYGGLRVPSISTGPVTVGKIFELMPFENELVVAYVKGGTIMEMASLIARKGGDPVSGLRMRISNQQATDIRVHGQPVVPDAIYTLVLSDYMSNGGDGYGFIRAQAVELKPLTRRVRDALIDELRYMRKQGRVLKPVTDGRIEKN